MATTELTFTTDKAAHAERRNLINSGAQVSLVAYDTARELYAFDVYTAAAPSEAHSYDLADGWCHVHRSYCSM